MTAESGLRAVFLQERRMLLRLLSARLGGMDDAEDALQDMWLRLETTPAEPIAQPAAYLYRMANNIAFDRRRSAARALARDSDWLETQTTADELPDIEQTLIARERLAQVEAALATLPEQAAHAFRRFRLAGVPQKDLAAEMGIPLSSLEKLLQRAYRCIHDRTRKAGAKESSAEKRAPRRPAKEEDFGP